MFERGKKDEEASGNTDTASATGQRNSSANASRSGGRSGEVAVIGQSIQIIGDLRGNEDLRIEGDVSGTVELKNSNLTIGKEGKVRADVYAKSIAVDGTTEGDLYATERVIVHVNANVRGNITAPRVALEEGARFKGSIEMDPAAVEKALAKANMQDSIKPAANGRDAKTTATTANKDVSAGTSKTAGVA